ncbi:MAG: ABC transporter permease [Firmicutes bacterium]|nr:ABC transporter permease [Bacillota bacterium]
MDVQPAVPSASGPEADLQIRPPSLLRRLARHRAALVGAVALAAIVFLCTLGPAVLHINPDAIDFTAFNSPPSWRHIMGTDDLGRDEFVRILYGGRISLLVGFLAMLIGVGLGGVVGAVAGYFGGSVDFVAMRVVDVALSIPRLFLLLLLSVTIGSGVFDIALIIGLTAWMYPARIMRAQVLSLRTREFVEAARAMGAGTGRILARAVVPNAVAPLIVNGTIQVGQAIVSESIMSFLGYGIQPPTPSWGNMLTNAQTFLPVSPWLAIFPGVMIVITVLAFNLVGDALRDALDPTGQQGARANRAPRRRRAVATAGT